jgi:two-component system response regulator YesN
MTQGEVAMFQLLIADDEYIEREALKSIVNRKFPDSFTFTEASTGLEVVGQAKLLEPDIIFMDIKMPGQSGIEAIRQIREFLPDTDIVIITAYDYFDYAKEAISLKVSEFLIKPIDVNCVIELLETLVKKLQKKKELQKYKFEVESKLEMIKTRYEQEFIDLLQNYNTTPEVIHDYLKIIDCSFSKGVAVIIDFEKIIEDQSIGNIQKEFICTRLLNRIMLQSEKIGLKCMTRSEEDIGLLFFVASSEKEPIAEEELKSEIIVIIEEIKKGMRTTFTYQCSNVINNADMLATEICAFKQSYIRMKKTCQYPYEIEERLIVQLEKKNFIEARTCILEMAKEFRKHSNSTLFQGEVHALYAVVRRCIKNLSVDALMPNADELMENIKYEYDLISYFNCLFDYMEQFFNQKSRKNQLLMNKICDYLEEHYQEDISLEEAAKIIGFSSYYFSKLMKEYCNISYVDYVSTIRMKKAKEFFDTTDKTINEVALLVGYSDPNYFTRVFKKLEGETPSAYKENRKMNI